MGWHKRLLSADPGAGYREYYWSNTDTGEVALQTQWLVDPVVTAAKASFNRFDERANWKGELHHVAYIPKHVIEYEWRVNKRRMLSDPEYCRWWADQPENKAFRTRPGKLTR